MLIGLLIACFVLLFVVTALYLTSVRGAVHVTTYAIMILLNDQLRRDHKAKFPEFVRACDASDPMDLATRCRLSIDRMAKEIGSNSPASLGVVQILWRYKSTGDIRDE